MAVTDRAQRIEDAALNMLLNKGYTATSMLAVAKAAKTSNQTMYRLYPNKQSLFAALVTQNTKRVASQIEELLEIEQSPTARLQGLGVALLTMLLSDEAIVLNRAAVGDVSDTQKLGAALAQNGRDVVAPKVHEICSQFLSAKIGKSPAPETAQEFTATYLDVLIGDLQIRRATGAIPRLEPSAIAARAARAFDIMKQLS